MNVRRAKLCFCVLLREGERNRRGESVENRKETSESKGTGGKEREREGEKRRFTGVGGVKEREKRRRRGSFL
jgi:hypothetical protein